MRTHYGPWQPCWISNQHQKHKSGRGPSSEHFWQVWLISVQRFQRRRFKCEKLTDGRRTLTHDKSSHGLWPGELKNINRNNITQTTTKTRGSQEPVIAHLVFNLTSKVMCNTPIILKVGHPKIISTQISEQKILM